MRFTSIMRFQYIVYLYSITKNINYEVILMQTTNTDNYPVDITVKYPTNSSRLLMLAGALIFVKFIMLIPHFIILALLNFVSGFVLYLAALIVLITGKYPLGIFTFGKGIIRWQTRVNGWIMGFEDKYPPFTFGSDTDSYSINIVQPEPPEKPSRLLALALILLFPKVILAIPYLIILSLLGMIAPAVTTIAQLITLITGKYPVMLFNIGVWNLLYFARFNAWYFGWIDKYPPFEFTSRKTD